MSAIDNSPEMLRQFSRMLDAHPHRDLTMNDVLQYLNDPAHLVIVGIAGPPGPRRTGVWLFLTMAEHTFYDPTKPEKAGEWELIMSLWSDMVWAIAVVPSRHQEKLERLAKRCGLHFSRGIPQAWTEPKYPNVVCQGASRSQIVPYARTMFPLDSRNVRTLEYPPERNGPKFTDKEENDQLKYWHERAEENARTNWWPDIIGAQ